MMLAPKDEFEPNCEIHESCMAENFTPNRKSFKHQTNLNMVGTPKIQKDLTFSWCTSLSSKQKLFLKYQYFIPTVEKALSQHPPKNSILWCHEILFRINQQKPPQTVDHTNIGNRSYAQWRFRVTIP